jgi:carboxypeptidase PM20D1
MKKFLLGLVAILIGLIAITVYRANTVFEDVQVAPADNLPEFAIDEAAAVERLAGAIRFKTISYDDRTNFDAETFLAFHDYVEQSFPTVHERATKTIINNYSLLYYVEGSDPSLKPIILMGHFDVVPVDDITLDEWTHPPFDGVVADGIVWGRGSMDDKNGVIGILEAAEALLSEGYQPKRSLYLAFGHDEEVMGPDGALQIANYLEAQGVEAEFVLDEGGAVISGMQDEVGHPVAMIGVGEKGYVNLRLRVNSPGGHSSMPPAQTALGILSRAIVKVEDNPFPAQLTYIQQMFEPIAAYASFGRRLALANTWLLGPVIESALLKNKQSAASMRTTTAATMASGSSKANILPTRAEAVINFRIIPGETAESVRDRVVELIDDDRVEVLMEYVMNPRTVSPTDSFGFQLLAKTIRGIDDNVIVAPYLVQGGTDSRYFYAVSPNVYRFTMVRAHDDSMRRVHGIDERLAIADYLEQVRFYHALIKLATE